MGQDIDCFKPKGYITITWLINSLTKFSTWQIISWQCYKADRMIKDCILSYILSLVKCTEKCIYMKRLEILLRNRNGTNDVTFSRGDWDTFGFVPSSLKRMADVFSKANAVESKKDWWLTCPKQGPSFPPCLPETS